LLGLLVPDDVRKEGGEKLQERLRNMFDVAARIGHQQRAKEIACAREEGYEAGRQEVGESARHTPLPLPHPRCHSIGQRTQRALPIPSPHPPLTPPTPRDFSALCTGISRPKIPRISRSPFRFTVPSNSFLPGPMPTQLDWDRDPRLCDLGRVLAALGWVRP
ncbi:hypothetical protein B0H14DRAFT_2943412, partial [Mycena olivaceomarginata]